MQDKNTEHIKWAYQSLFLSISATDRFRNALGIGKYTDTCSSRYAGKISRRSIISSIGFTVRRKNDGTVTAKSRLFEVAFQPFRRDLCFQLLSDTLHLFSIFTGTVFRQRGHIQPRKIFAPAKFGQKLIPERLGIAYVEGSCQCLDTIKLEGLAIVYWVCRHESGQQSFVRTFNFSKGNLVEARPRALYNRNTVFVHNRCICRREHLRCAWSQYNATKTLTDSQFLYETMPC